MNLAVGGDNLAPRLSAEISCRLNAARALIAAAGEHRISPQSALDGADALIAAALTHAEVLAASGREHRAVAGGDGP